VGQMASTIGSIGGSIFSKFGSGLFGGGGGSGVSESGASLIGRTYG